MGFSLLEWAALISGKTAIHERLFFFVIGTPFYQLTDVLLVMKVW